MKITSIIILLVMSPIFVFATEQVPDYLTYKNNNMYLSTGWGHPSPLQTYYCHNEEKYPFIGLATNNYRGHVAYWEIDNDKLYLTKIKIYNKYYSPSKFLYSHKLKKNEKSRIYAEWFSGIIECVEVIKNNDFESDLCYYFQVENGQVKELEILTREDIRTIAFNKNRNIDEKQFIKKRNMYLRYNNYLTYYFRLNDEKIELDNEACRLEVNYKHLSPLLSYYRNDPLQWKYNWNNLIKSGAPNCTWKIEDSKLFLKGVNLFYGLRIDSVEIERLEMSSLFNREVKDSTVFAAWVTGIYLIKHGHDEEDKEYPDIKRFVITKYTFIYIECGHIRQRFDLQADFNIDKLPKIIDNRLKKFIRNYF